jgi:hypothetical protein
LQQADRRVQRWTGTHARAGGCYDHGSESRGLGGQLSGGRKALLEPDYGGLGQLAASDVGERVLAQFVGGSGQIEAIVGDLEGPAEQVAESPEQHERCCGRP